MTLLVVLGVALVLLGAFLAYLGSPNQLVRAQPIPGRWAWMGVGAILLGLVLLLQWAGPATTVFMVLTLVMLVWTLVPLTAAWLKGDRKAAR